MSLKRNTYRTRGRFLKLSAKAIVKRSGGKTEEVYVKFRGRYNPNPIPGEFITQDQDLIKALDKHGDLNKLFILHKSEEVKGDDDFVESAATAEKIVSETTPPKKEEDPITDANVAPEEPVADAAPEEPVAVSSEVLALLETITTVQKAKEFLIKAYGVSNASVQNKKLVLEVAGEKGIEFPNLPK